MVFFPPWFTAFDQQVNKDQPANRKLCLRDAVELCHYCCRCLAHTQPLHPFGPLMNWKTSRFLAPLHLDMHVESHFLEAEWKHPLQSAEDKQTVFQLGHSAKPARYLTDYSIHRCFFQVMHIYAHFSVYPIYISLTNISIQKIQLLTLKQCAGTLDGDKQYAMLHIIS